MTEREFCYWLQGFFENANPVHIDVLQTRLIKAHLNMVFAHAIDPSYPKDQQAKLNDLHNGVKESPKTHVVHTGGVIPAGTPAPPLMNKDMAITSGSQKATEAALAAANLTSPVLPPKPLSEKSPMEMTAEEFEAAGRPRC